MRWRALVVAGAVVLLLALGVGRLGMIGRGPADASGRPRCRSPTAAPAPTSHITATLFFGDAGGRGLVARRVDVPLARRSPTRARRSSSRRSPIRRRAPRASCRVGTRVRAFYLDGTGTGFVDLSGGGAGQAPGRLLCARR